MSRVKSQEPIGERIAAHVEVTKFARDLDRSPSLGFYWLLSLYVKSRAQNRFKKWFNGNIPCCNKEICPYVIEFDRNSTVFETLVPTALEFQNR